MSDAKTMTNKERALKASKERWNPSISKSTHTGVLVIGGQEIACDVLEDGRRILRRKNFENAMGKKKAKHKNIERATELKIPYFVISNNLAPYLEPIMLERGEQVFYKSIEGKKLIGYEACILPEACKMYVKADDDGVLQKQQKPIASVCRSMLYALATVGITALVDECTGFQEVRQRNELQKILEKYISEELRGWTKKFPNEFFKQVYRLHNWEYSKTQNSHPQYIGKIINKYVYDRLPPGVLEELKNKNPINENGNRKFKHHQFLTQDIGEKNLQGQIQQVVTLMRVSKNIDEFREFMDRCEFVEMN